MMMSYCRQDEGKRQLEIQMQINDEHLQNKTVDSIYSDLWGQNVLQFSLKSYCIYKSFQDNYVRQCRVNVMCNDIDIRFLPENKNNLTSGSMIGGPLPCETRILCNYIP